MKNTKKLLTLLLAISMSCAPLAACKKQEPTTEPDQQTQNEAAQDTEFELLDEPVVLCEGETAHYSIVRPAASIDSVGEVVSMILKYPSTQAAPGLKLSWGNDKGEGSAAEILIGYTNRPESKEVLESIEHDDFAIVLKNGKIVVAAHTEERLVQAAEYLCDNLLRVQTNENGQKSLVYLGNYTFTGPKKYLFNHENSLENYVIVYGKNSQSLRIDAEKVQAAFKNEYGVELPLVDDSTAEQACEILIGNVDRPFAKECFEDTPQKSAYSYTITAKDQKLLVGAKQDAITALIIDSFCEEFFHPEHSPFFNLPADLKEVREALSFSDATELAEDANLRIMSFNILCELWDSKAGIAGREIYVAAPILTYKPDVLGLQEVSEAWHKALMPLLEESYAVADPLDDWGTNNFCPLLYNTETLTLLKHGVHALPYASTKENHGLRVVSWGYFERKSDGARFLAFNTHWNHGSTDADNSERLAQARDMAQFIAAMQKEYNCSVVTTGDYNNRTEQEPYEFYVSKTGFKDAGLHAKVVNRLIKTTHSLFTSSVSQGPAIDHVFLSEGFEILYYNTLCDKFMANASDHYPVYADVKLNP